MLRPLRSFVQGFNELAGFAQAGVNAAFLQGPMGNHNPNVRSPRYDRSMTNREFFIVEVDAFEGEAASIAVTDAEGIPLRAVYCVARRDEMSGVLRFVDYGYTSISEAREAWPDAQ